VGVALAAEGAFTIFAMAIPSRSAQSGTFFVTSATYNRRHFFQVGANAELFLETLQHYRHEGKYLLHDFVVMPEHIHLLLTPRETTLERVMGLIKGGFSHRIGSSFPLWQKSFTDHRIRDRADFLARRKYIHENPVKEGLVERAEDYPYSSAFRKRKKEGE
jgi:putative transposase